MGLRKKRDSLRKGATDKVRLIRNDINSMIEMDGDTVTFTWKETTGAVWNSTYEVWEGGTIENKSLEVRGIGKTVDYVDDEMEYEYGRIEVGECIVRFPYDFDLSQFGDKEELRFIYKQRKWRIDGSLNWVEKINNQVFAKVIKGVRSLD